MLIFFSFNELTSQEYNHLETYTFFHVIRIIICCTMVFFVIF